MIKCFFINFFLWFAVVAAVASRTFIKCIFMRDYFVFLLYGFCCCAPDQRKFDLWRPKNGKRSFKLNKLIASVCILTEYLHSELNASRASDQAKLYYSEKMSLCVCVCGIFQMWSKWERLKWANLLKTEKINKQDD